MTRIKTIINSMRIKIYRQSFGYSAGFYITCSSQIQVVGLSFHAGPGLKSKSVPDLQPEGLRSIVEASGAKSRPLAETPMGFRFWDCVLRAWGVGFRVILSKFNPSQQLAQS